MSKNSKSYWKEVKSGSYFNPFSNQINYIWNLGQNNVGLNIYPH